MYTLNNGRMMYTMDNRQFRTKFESLSNEILIECFDYLNALDIFYSFDQLNHRFNTLIRNIPLHLTFENIHQKSLCDQFCMKMSCEKTIKKHIRALHLSNKNTCYPIHLFLSTFSLLDFAHLQSLTLTKVTLWNSEELQTILPLMTELFSFRIIDLENKLHEVQSTLPLSHLPVLMTSKSSPVAVPITEYSSITKLIIYQCSLDKLSKLLRVTRKLNYLEIGQVNTDASSTMTTKSVSLINNHVSNLKKLNIMMFRGTFDDLVMILKQTSNLKSLTINTDNNEDMANARQWQYLITSSLLRLKIFKFNFQFSCSKVNNTVQEKFKKFQNDFWHNQHHWYTEYSLSDYSASIYSIPYLFDTFHLTSDVNRYTNPLINNMNTFDNVKNLVIYPETLAVKSEYYFSNVTSLTFEETNIRHEIVQEMELIQYMTMINLSNLKHVTVADAFRLTEIRNALKEVFDNAPQLSSLQIDIDALRYLLRDQKIRKYLIKTIKTLDVTGEEYTSWDRYDEFYDIYDYTMTSKYSLHITCQIFTNLEQLTCHCSRENSLNLIKHLPKLTYLSIRSPDYYNTNWLEGEVRELGLDLTSHFSDDNLHSGNLLIWIYRKMR